MLKQPHLMNTALRDDFSNHQNRVKITALIWSTYKLLPTASAIKLGWSLFNNLKYVSSYGMNGDYWQCDLWLLYKAMNLCIHNTQQCPLVNCHTFFSFACSIPRSPQLYLYRFCLEVQCVQPKSSKGWMLYECYNIIHVNWIFW